MRNIVGNWGIPQKCVREIPDKRWLSEHSLDRIRLWVTDADVVAYAKVCRWRLRRFDRF